MMSNSIPDPHGLFVDGKPIEDCDVEIVSGEHVTSVDDIVLAEYEITRDAEMYPGAGAVVSTPELSVHLTGIGIETRVEEAYDPDPEPHPNCRCTTDSPPEPTSPGEVAVNPLTAEVAVDDEEPIEIESIGYEPPEEDEEPEDIFEIHDGIMYEGSFEMTVEGEERDKLLEMLGVDTEVEVDPDALVEELESTDGVEDVDYDWEDDPDVVDNCVGEDAPEDEDEGLTSEQLAYGEEPPETDAEPANPFAIDWTD